LLRIGAVLRLTSPGTEPWDIAIGAPNWWRTPIPTAIAVFSDATGYVIDVITRRTLVEVPGAIRVRQDALHDLILLLTEDAITAVGPTGVAWESDRMGYEDLKVVAIDTGRIVCTSYVGADFPAEFIVDPASGKARRVE
jgi:hypothetical protein